MEQGTDKKRHRLSLDKRARLEIEGVVEVESFDDVGVLLLTDCGELNIEGKPADTFLRLDGFKKGFVTINGFNLGRYWEIGPTKTLYVPAPMLKEGKNEIIVFESDGTATATVEFFAKPDLGR